VSNFLDLLYIFKLQSHSQFKITSEEHDHCELLSFQLVLKRIKMAQKYKNYK
jgi:hypothetical protein